MQNKYRIALSYAGDDRLFVGHIAQILEKYLGKESVFHYTFDNTKTNIVSFFQFTNDCLKNESNPDVIIRTICFVREIGRMARIVVGQQTELLDRDESKAVSDEALKTWQGITNCRQAGSIRMKTVAVPLPSHGIDPERLSQWSIPFNLTCFGQATVRYDRATDMDRSSAEQVAEFVLRDVLGLRQQTHACKAFTYEKNIISFYADLQALLRKTPFLQLEPEKRDLF